MDIPFDGNASSVTFQLKFPATSQLVAVVSDSRAFGNGGTSAPARVLPSNDDSCFDPTVRVPADFYFNIEPQNQFVQCRPTRLWWDPALVRGQTEFFGVIPAGQSFAIPQAELTSQVGFGTGFNWTVNVRTGTTMVLTGGDSRRRGNAGSVTYFISGGIDQDDSCLNSDSPSATPGDPAGGSYATGIDGSGTGGGNGNGGGGTNTGAIVGGVVGGVVFLVSFILVLFFLNKRSKQRQRAREKPVDLLNEGEDEDGDGGNRESRNDLPQFYRPEPFTVPDPSLRNSAGEDDSARPLSGTATSFYTRSGTPDGSAALGYGAGLLTGGPAGAGAPRVMRPVNIIQHDDAGPSLPPPAAGDDEQETIELPPAYTAIKATPTP
ncbi:hypothetical protein FA15DRAFT_679586 [Coprinopsis marcescibilis]|uniref:Peptidase A1 domain-containing protein n=1 Tax=Coprinopsis marcescibilis TaxID=230819 RepID=A0A5C3L156_COPMA|nr:hypothetical protein FA15DRAFT_679586 [Coprinopsis marcescibilis]